MDGNGEQIRSLLEQIAKAAVTEYAREHEEPPASTTTTVLKWVAGVFGAVMSGVFIAGCVWLFSTLSAVQLSLRDVTTALGTNGVVEARFGELNRRLTDLEEIHKEQAKRGRE